jgi:hypothetical protein
MDDAPDYHRARNATGVPTGIRGLRSIAGPSRIPLCKHDTRKNYGFTTENAEAAELIV